MSSDYQKGFKDGFAAGLEEGKKLSQKNYWTEPWPTTPNVSVRESCPKCGMKISGVMGFVCSSPNCPTFPNITCGVPLHGAVGSEISYSHGVGSNGPAGPPDNNSVWINGTWASLGN